MCTGVGVVAVEADPLAAEGVIVRCSTCLDDDSALSFKSIARGFKGEREESEGEEDNNAGKGEAATGNGNTSPLSDDVSAERRFRFLFAFTSDFGGVASTESCVPEPDESDGGCERGFTTKKVDEGFRVRSPLSFGSFFQRSTSDLPFESGVLAVMSAHKSSMASTSLCSPTG